MYCNFDGREINISGEDGKYTYYKCEYCVSYYKEHNIEGKLELLERGYNDRFLLEKALEYMDISKNDLIEMINISS